MICPIHYGKLTTWWISFLAENCMIVNRPRHFLNKCSNKMSFTFSLIASVSLNIYNWLKLKFYFSSLISRLDIIFSTLLTVFETNHLRQIFHVYCKIRRFRETKHGGGRRLPGGGTRSLRGWDVEDYGGVLNGGCAFSAFQNYKACTRFKSASLPTLIWWKMEVISFFCGIFAILT